MLSSKSTMAKPENQWNLQCRVLRRLSNWQSERLQKLGVKVKQSNLTRAEWRPLDKQAEPSIPSLLCTTGSTPCSSSQPWKTAGLFFAETLDWRSTGPLVGLGTVQQTRAFSDPKMLKLPALLPQPCFPGWVPKHWQHTCKLDRR